MADRQTSPGNALSPSRLCLPHLRPRFPCRYWALSLIALSPSMAASYAISVRQASALPAASFRSHLAVNTLAVRLTVPPAGSVGDLHPQVSAPCRAHNKKAPRPHKGTRSRCSRGPTLIGPQLAPKAHSSRIRTAALNAPALYPLSCNGESLRRSLLAVTPTRPRLVRTPGSGSVAVSDRAHTAPGSLPELAALTLPDHRFNMYGWMLSMMITWAGRFSNRLSGILAARVSLDNLG